MNGTMIDLTPLAEMYSFDHDLEEFVAIGLGTVSVDGSVIESNPGVGVVKAGWHCGSQPAAGGDVGGICIPDGSIANHIVNTVPANIGGNITLSLGRAVDFSMSAEVNGQMAPDGLCSSKVKYEWAFHDFSGNRQGATTREVFNKAGVYKVDAIASGYCKCPINSTITMTVTVGEIQVTSSSDPDSARVDSFVTAPLAGVVATDGKMLAEDAIVAKYLGALGPGEFIVWKVEAMPSTDSKAPLFSGYGGIEVLTQANGGTGVTGAGSGSFGSPWKSDPSNIVTTVKFLPKPPQHLPASYTGGLQNASVAGTKGIDKYQRNPQLAYKISATILPTGREIVPMIVRMDEKDMIRQEYITHIVSAPESAIVGGRGVQRIVTVPTRNLLRARTNMPVGDWVDLADGYQYQYLIADGIEMMWTDYQTAWNATGKKLTISVDPYTITMPADDGIRVSSAYRNPERQEFYGTATKSLHMMGRALDIAATGVLSLGTSANPTPSFARGVVFNIVSNAIETNTIAKPYWDLWQLEDIDIAVVRNRAGWANPDDALDIGPNRGSGNGIPDGYERTGHLHLQDDPTKGNHR